MFAYVQWEHTKNRSLAPSGSSYIMYQIELNWTVSLMPLVAAWKNQLVEKVQEQGGLFRDSVTTQSTFAAFKTHFGCTFTIPTSGNILMQLGSVYRSALLTSTFPDTAVYSCTDLISNVPPVANYSNFCAIQVEYNT